MRSHVRTLAILEIVYASLGLLVAVFILLLFGGIATLVGFNAAPDDGAVAAPILALIGTVVAVIISVLALPRLIAGIGLLQYRNWARILTLILSALSILEFPIGTALGVYGFWALTNTEAVALFEQPRQFRVA